MLLYIFHIIVWRNCKRKVDNHFNYDHSYLGKHFNILVLSHYFLLQIMQYVYQRLPTMNEFCVVCDEPHVFERGGMLKVSRDY